MLCGIHIRKGGEQKACDRKNFATFDMSDAGMAKNPDFRYNHVMPTRTKFLLATACALLVTLCIVHGEMMLPHALAQGAIIPDVQGESMQNALRVIATLNVVGFGFLKILSYLGDPDTIFGINDSGILLRMWQISRDIMNMIFAILLLGGAIMTVVFAKQDIIKQNIVKFLLAVVLVNFSWFFPRVILDIANVTTATIYNLPHIVVAPTFPTAPVDPGLSTTPCMWRDGTGFARNCIVMSDIIFSGSTATCPIGPGIPAELDLTIAKVCLVNYDPNANTAFGIINGLVLNHGRLMNLGLIVGAPPGGGAGAPVIDVLYFGFVLTIVAFLHFMLVFPMIALTLVMLVRIPILWLTISFMPFMFIGFLIGDKFIKVNTMEIFRKHFLVAAFLPAMIAIPFSIGFIMLNAFATLHPSAPPGLDQDFNIIDQVGTWWDMLWILISFMVIWIGTKWAMKADDIYSKITEPVYSLGKNVLQLPLNAPIFAHDTNGNNKRDPGEDRFGIKDVFRTSQSDKGLANVVFGGNETNKPGQGKNPGAQNAANELNRNGLNKEELDKLGDTNVKLDDVRNILTRIQTSVTANTGTKKDINVTIDVLQRAATAKGRPLTNPQIDAITKRLKEDPEYK